MRKSVTVVALATFAVTAVSTAGYAQAPQPDPKSANYQAKGEQEKTYVFPGTTENISYHIYVPMKWDKNTKLPLVILTHGANQPSSAPFQRPMANPTLAKMAEERGFIVAAVTGYHANATGVGGWNVPYPMVQVQRAPRAGGAAGGGAPGAGAAAAAPAAAAGAAAAAPGAAPAAGAPGGGGQGGGGRAGRGPAAPPATAEDFARAEQDIL